LKRSAVFKITANGIGLCVRWRLKPQMLNLKTKLYMSTKVKSKNETANGTKPVLADSKKNRVRCTKNLVAKDNKVCFFENFEYDVMETTPILLLRNRYGQRHSITGEWLDFFYFC
jgi:hypothetical protein